MKAYLIYADGTFEGVDGAAGHYLHHNDRVFRQAGVARDRNTMCDGMQLKGSDGPPNLGMLVYIEIPDPPYASARMVLA